MAEAKFDLYQTLGRILENNTNRRQPLCCAKRTEICRKSGIWNITANFLLILLFLSKSLKCIICKVLRGVTYSLSTLHNLYK